MYKLKSILVAANLVDDPVWVMNIVPAEAKNTIDSFRKRFKSSNNPVGKFLGQFKYLKKGKRKPKRIVSDFSWLSGFAAMELSSQLKLVFKFIDANGDGRISPLELKEILLSLGHHQEWKPAEKLAEVMV
ncbi:hypothetical protein CQW23_14049 [Capsicum baccatum]|uniref:EF-hand domain-containing protein n=1 Tax=Capsicum baccatum TaxID=33114 RepID=A0A2G2WI26_CAPBA|nr:hypothetical protein CQW23_14049 [Capsicum baccatum]